MPAAFTGCLLYYIKVCPNREIEGYRRSYVTKSTADKRICLGTQNKETKQTSFISSLSSPISFYLLFIYYLHIRCIYWKTFRKPFVELCFRFGFNFRCYVMAHFTVSHC